MLKKLLLNQTQTYELCIACRRSAEMLVAFLQGREHDLQIGSEQGDISTWDDLVIEQNDGTYEHIQIKRQQTDFDNHPCIRDTYTKQPRTGQLRDLFPLDKTMEALAKWIAAGNDPSTTTPPRRFVIEVPGNQSLIKEGLEIRHFSNFCHNVIKQSTTVAQLSVLQISNEATKKIFNWLTTWCGFTNWSDILKALRRLAIRVEGNEADIEAETEKTLKLCFNQPKKVRQDILTFINNNSGFTSAVKPRPLLGHLQSYTLPSLSVWTQYVKNGNSWHVTGTTDTEFGSVESAAKVVHSLWNGKKTSSLKINVSTISNELMQDAITRLIIHLSHLTHAHVNNAILWHQKASQSVGETLGINSGDCNAFPLIECTDTFASSDKRPLDTLALSDSEAHSLVKSMNAITWELICERTEHCIATIPGKELRDAIDIKWRTWKSMLTNNADECFHLCRLMMHPKAEGGEIKADLRYGMKTAELIANSFLLLLTVSVALGEENTDWKELKSSLTIEAKAIKFWSGPYGYPRNVRKLTGEGLNHLLGKEQAKVLILSGIESCTSEIKDELLSSERKQTNSLATPKQPMLIVTFSMKLERLIRQGNIGSIKSFLENEMNSITDRSSNLE